MKLGTLDANYKLGSVAIDKIMLGSNLVYEAIASTPDRYFTTFKSLTQSHIELDAQVTVTNFTFECLIYLKSNGDRARVFGNKTDLNGRAVVLDTGQIQLITDQGATKSSAVDAYDTYFDKLTKLTFIKNGTQGQVLLNDTLVFSPTFVATETFTFECFNRQNTVYGDSILADIKLTNDDTSTVEFDLPVDGDYTANENVVYNSNDLGNELLIPFSDDAWETQGAGTVTITSANSITVTVAGSGIKLINTVSVNSTYLLSVSNAVNLELWLGLSGGLAQKFNTEGEYIAVVESGNDIVYLRAPNIGDASGDVSVRELTGTYGTSVNVADGDSELFSYSAVDNGWLGNELVVNGGFDTDSGWSKGVGWTIENGVAKYISQGSDAVIRQFNTLNIGDKNIISIECKEIISSLGGRFILRNPDNSSVLPIINSEGVFNYVITVESATLTIRGEVSDLEGSIDNVSAKRILEL